MTVIDTQTGPAPIAAFAATTATNATVTNTTVTNAVATTAVTGGAIDDVRIDSRSEVVAHTVIRGGAPSAPVYPGVLPLAAARRAVAELVDHNRGPGWHVELHEVAALRLFGPLANGDLLTTRVRCQQFEAQADEVVAVARCTRAGTPIASLTMRLAVVRDVPSTERSGL
jgi:hypothetical protein